MFLLISFIFTGSCQDLEYDFYDCHLDNVMAAPGSLFCSPSMDLGNDPLFPESPVVLRSRISGGRQGHERLVESITSDLTSSITSAASVSTLVGDEPGIEMEASCYYSDAEEAEGEETTSFLQEKAKTPTQEQTTPFLPKKVYKIAPHMIFED